MSASDVRGLPGRAPRSGGRTFDLVMSKLRRPVTRPGTVHRSLLVERLARDDLRPVVSVAAPAGYGKTTLLSQWAELNNQAFAWVSVDDRDNDPKVLLTYIAEALDLVEPVGEWVFDALASPTREEAAVLLRDAQVQVGQDDLTGLHERTEGWAAGLYLAALALRAARSGTRRPRSAGMTRWSASTCNRSSWPGSHSGGGSS
jgi:ATP/maltotriose-dependent transcriptional regulator MalT